MIVKMLKPYYIKAETNHVRIVLAYQYFSVIIDNKVYQFVPIESKEIRIHRKTKKIVNIHDTFAFQRGKDVIFRKMTDLVAIPEFIYQLNSLAEPYFNKSPKTTTKKESDTIIEQLEKLNLSRLIDKALDTRDESSFYELVKWL